MPATSKAQLRFFQAMKNNPAEAKKKGISPQLANEYTQGMTSSRFKKLRQRIGKKNG